MSAALKPEDLLEPGNFPDDLKWVPAHYKLHPTDPVYLLIAWHWRRVKQSEDTLKATIVEIKKALDDRIGHLTEAAETVAGVNDALADVQVALDLDPQLPTLTADGDQMFGPPLGLEQGDLPPAALIGIAHESTLRAHTGGCHRIHGAALGALEPDLFDHARRRYSGRHQARSTMRSMRKLDCSSASAVKSPKNSRTSVKSREKAA